jgi:hypothetical protein
MIPIFVTVFAADGLALAGTDAAADPDGAIDGAAADAVDGLAVPGLAQAPAMREMAARLAAHADSL